MSDLILWRHGQTDYNVAGRVQGQVDIPLNETGLAQARAAAPSLAALNPSRILSSPLQRAQATAGELARLTGCEVEVLPGLAERDFGQWEGLTREQMEAGWPSEFAAWRQGKDPRGVGVETRAHTSARIGAAIRAALAQIPDAAARPGTVSAPGPVVVVAHGAAITLGACDLLGMDPSAWFGLRGLDNCHWAHLRSSMRSPGWMLVGWNIGARPAVSQAGDGGQAGHGNGSQPTDHGECGGEVRGGVGNPSGLPSEFLA